MCWSVYGILRRLGNAPAPGSSPAGRTVWADATSPEGSPGAKVGPNIQEYHRERFPSGSLSFYFIIFEEFFYVDSSASLLNLS